MSMLTRFAASGGAPTDPYFENVTLLLHGDGTNGAQNNTFIDSSTNNFTVTRNGNTTQGSFSPYGDLWSNYFDGSGDSLTAPNNAAFDFGSGDFTIECWVYKTNSTLGYIANKRLIASQLGPFQLFVAANGVIQFNGYSGSGADWTVYALGPSAITLNTWNHIAVVRSGNVFTVYVNGVAGTPVTNSVTLQTNTTVLRIGNDDANIYPIAGYISNFRVVKGTAVYTGNFTPSTTPLTAITNTSLLTCQSNRFRDASSNNFTITRTGDVSVQRFSPFASEYSSSTNGGSGYFDGTSDYLTVPDNASLEISSSNFTIETWYYPLALPATSTSQILIQKGITSSSNFEFQFNIYNNAGTLRLRMNYATNGTTAIVFESTSGTFRLGEWHHIAVTRSGSTWTLWLNGVNIGSTTISATVFSGSGVVSVGANSAAVNPVNGYLSDARIVKGSAVYTAAFTPPTAPLTAITNTSLLLNFTNGAIFDNTALNDLETVGNAQISTSVKKFGTGSLSFDGTGDNVNSKGGVVVDFGTGDFTVEAWSYLTSAGDVYPFIFSLAYPTSKAVQLRYGNTGFGQKLQVAVQGDTTSNTWSCSATQTSHLNQWVYLAFTRQSGVCRLFVDGVLQSINSGANPSTYPVTSFTDTTNVTGTSAFSVGSGYTGYIDDVRVTKGVARYTANFTPPTAPFPNQ